MEAKDYKVGDIIVLSDLGKEVLYNRHGLSENGQYEISSIYDDRRSNGDGIIFKLKGFPKENTGFHSSYFRLDVSQDIIKSLDKLEKEWKERTLR